MRIERERSLAWFSAMLPHLKKPMTLEEFTGHKPDRSDDLRRCIEAWNKVDAALRRNRGRTG